MASRSGTSQSAAVKRILLEVKELRKESENPHSFFKAAPLENDLFEWHFTVRGPPDTEFDGGVYHGRILLPTEYPLKAPDVMLLTPNGRFEVNTRICLSITSYHQESWQPSWGIRTILTALVAFMPSKAEGLGSLNYSPEERKVLAKKSMNYECNICGCKCKEEFPAEMKSEDKLVMESEIENARKEAEKSLPAGSGTQAGKEEIVKPAAESVQSSAEELPQPGPRPEPIQSIEPTGALAGPQEIRQDVSPAPAPAPAPPSQGPAPAMQMAPRPVISAQRQAQTVVTVENDKELKYLALAIVAVMLAIILRRVYTMMDIDLLR